MVDRSEEVNRALRANVKLWRIFANECRPFVARRALSEARRARGDDGFGGVHGNGKEVRASPSRDRSHGAAPSAPSARQPPTSSEIVGGALFPHHRRVQSLSRGNIDPPSECRLRPFAMPPPPNFKPPTLGGLGVTNLSMNGTLNLTRASVNTDLTASYNMDDEGIKLLSESRREFKLTETGFRASSHRDPRARRDSGVSARDPTQHPRASGEGELHYNCSARDVVAFGALGSGAGGVVKKAVHVPSHRFIALKSMTVFEREKRAALIAEMKLLCEQQGGRDAPGDETPGRSNVVRFIGAFYSPETNLINIALEYVEGGSLESLVKRGGAVPQDVLGKICGGVCAGLEYLHAHRRTVHRDIKPGNILVRLNGEPVITDFGVSAELGDSRALLDSFKGTLHYMSPERVENKDYDFAADVWSLGLTMLECAIGRYPYDATDGGPLGLMVQITRDECPIPPNAGLGEHLAGFVGRCMRKNPRERPSATRLRSGPHPYIAENERVDAGEWVRSVVSPLEILEGNADAFVRHYYRLVDRVDVDVGTLAAVYRDGSCLTTAQGDQIRGAASIAACVSRRAAAGAGGLRRDVASLDVLPGGVEGGMLVMATGTLRGGVGMGEGGVGGSHGDARRMEEAGAEGGGLRGAGLRFSFAETFLVFRVHAGWSRVGAEVGSTESGGTGQFYVRNQIERWSRLGGAYPV